MAQRTITMRYDDLTGEPEAESFGFYFDGDKYEIDLVKSHGEDLTEALSEVENILRPYIEHGRIVEKAGTTAAKRPRRSGSSKNDSAEIRAWAAQNGYTLSERGRIPTHVRTAFAQRPRLAVDA